MSPLQHEARLFCVALQFLTRVPAPAWAGRDGWEPAWLNRAVRYFPLVGALVGTLGGAVAFGAQRLWPPWVAATLAVATTLWLTAAFHEDGLADTFDALLGAAPRERALAIMKDSRIGSYGAAALALSLLLRVALLAELLVRDPLLAAAACVAAHAGARACAVALMAGLPYAGDAAHAKAKPLARAVRGIDAAWAAAIAVLALVPALVLAPVSALAPASGPAASPLPAMAAVAGACVLALVALALVLRRWLLRRLGGYTGDALGACEQLGEIALGLVFVAAWAR